MRSISVGRLALATTFCGATVAPNNATSGVPLPIDGCGSSSVVWRYSLWGPARERRPPTDEPGESFRLDVARGGARATHPHEGQLLLIGITRFQLVANRKYQNDFVVWQPPIFGDVSMPTSGKHEFSAPLLGEPAHQWVVGQQFECAPDT